MPVVLPSAPASFVPPTSPVWVGKRGLWHETADAVIAALPQARDPDLLNSAHAAIAAALLVPVGGRVALLQKMLGTALLPRIRARLRHEGVPCAADPTRLDAPVHDAPLDDQTAFARWAVAALHASGFDPLRVGWNCTNALSMASLALLTVAVPSQHLAAPIAPPVAWPPSYRQSARAAAQQVVNVLVDALFGPEAPTRLSDCSALFLTVGMAVHAARANGHLPRTAVTAAVLTEHLSANLDHLPDEDGRVVCLQRLRTNQALWDQQVLQDEAAPLSDPAPPSRLRVM